MRRRIHCCRWADTARQIDRSRPARRAGAARRGIRGPGQSAFVIGAGRDTYVWPLKLFDSVPIRPLIFVGASVTHRRRLYRKILINGRMSGSPASRRTRARCRRFCRLVHGFQSLPTVGAQSITLKLGQRTAFRASCNQAVLVGEGVRLRRPSWSRISRFRCLASGPRGCDHCCERESKGPDHAHSSADSRHLVGGSASLFAETPAWQPTAGHLTLPLWPNGRRVPHRIRCRRPIPQLRKITSSRASRSSVSATFQVPASPSTLHGQEHGAAVVVFPGAVTASWPLTSKEPRCATGSIP